MRIGTRSRSWAAVSALLVIGTMGTAQNQPVASSSVPVSLDVPGRVDASPWIAASGSFVAVAWGATADSKTDVFLAVSRDGGGTFGPPVRVNRVAGEARLGGELPPRVALTARRGAAVPEVVVLWTAAGGTTAIKIARSRDGGSTFGAPVTLQSPAALGDRGWPAVAVDSRATAHAIWLDHRGMAVKPGAGGKAHTGHQAGSGHGSTGMAEQSALYYASQSPARTSRERQLTTGVCYCCKTALAAGPDGSLYAAWRHVYPGNFRDMAFSVSRDAGRSFSAPVRVSEDGWAINGCPDDGPAMAVDARGTAHLVWPTVIPGATPQGALYYASTRDGRRFTARLRIPTLGGPRPAHPQIVIDGGGRIVVAWDEIVNGRRVAAARELKLRGEGPPVFGDTVMLSPDGGAIYYPVLAATDTGIVAVWTRVGDASRVEVQRLRIP